LGAETGSKHQSPKLSSNGQLWVSFIKRFAFWGDRQELSGRFPWQTPKTKVETEVFRRMGYLVVDS